MADSKLRVFDYVDQLNVIIDRAAKVPLSTRVIVDKQDLKQTLQRLESSIDPDIRTAKDIIQQYDELIQKANRQAEQVTAEASENARRTVDDAAARAQATLQEAQARAAEISRDAVDKAIARARQSASRPTLIICKTHIGHGSPNRHDTSKAHGEPLGAEEIALVRKEIGWNSPPFEIPDDVYQAWDARAAGREAQSQWEQLFANYEQEYPQLAKEFDRRMAARLPEGFAQAVLDASLAAHHKEEKVASRKASQMALETLTATLPELLGGSADLTGSNLTQTASTPPVRFDAGGAVLRDAEGRIGRHINYGVREFAMAAVMNGIALHGGFIPYGGTFLTFSDYSRNAIRMAALMRQRVVHVFTHDSIGLGEDGPTHQSIEHAASLRLIPNLDVWRPADTVETLTAWAAALAHQSQPTALLLSRQALPYAPKRDLSCISRGGYVLAEPQDAGINASAQAVLMATGSEVALALAAQALLAKRRVAVRVVSMPSTTTFDRQDAAYRRAVLPAALPRIALEMGRSDFWRKYGCAAVVGIDCFGESAPAEDLFKHFGFTPENVAAHVLAVLGLE